jgi:hypothetical protein
VEFEYSGYIREHLSINLQDNDQFEPKGFPGGNPVTVMGDKFGGQGDHTGWQGRTDPLCVLRLHLGYPSRKSSRVRRLPAPLALPLNAAGSAACHAPATAGAQQPGPDQAMRSTGLSVLPASESAAAWLI